jgi:hypothetical protein
MALLQRVRIVFAALSLVAGLTLAACGGTRATVSQDPTAPRTSITLTAPATTTLVDARVGDTLVCKSKGKTVRAKVPPSGQLNKGVGQVSPSGASSSAQLQVTRQDGAAAVVVACTS